MILIIVILLVMWISNIINNNIENIIISNINGNKILLKWY